MTRLKIFSLVFVSLLFGNSPKILAAPIEAKVPLDHVFVPKGFDANDNSQIILSGFLPDLCHRSPRAKVLVKEDQINIDLVSLYSPPSGARYCTPILIPFVEVVNIGMLDRGHYEVVINGGLREGDRSSLYVSESTSEAVDDNVYAGVEYVEKRPNSRKVLLRGYNPSDCYQLDKIDWISNGTDTLAVMPIMKKVSDFCPMKMMPFTYEWEVPTELKNDIILLHVRRVEGNSVNVLFPNK